MSDKNKFFEMLTSITEVAKVQDNHISREEIKKLFGDMELNESQYEHVYAYLAANSIKIDGYVEVNNEYRQAVLHDLENEIVEEAGEDTGEDIESETEDETETITKNSTKVNNAQHAEKNSIYLKMYLEDLSAIDELGEEEEKELFDSIKNGDEHSKVRLIEGYLKIVVKIAKEYVNKGILIEDLIGEGNMGLMSGVNSINELENYNNITVHLENEIRKTLIDVTNDNSEQDDLAKRVLERADYLNSESNELMENLGRIPTVKELSEYTKISVDEIKDILNMSGDSINVVVQHSHEESK